MTTISRGYASDLATCYHRAMIEECAVILKRSTSDIERNLYRAEIELIAHSGDMMAQREKLRRRAGEIYCWERSPVTSHPRFPSVRD